MTNLILLAVVSMSLMIGYEFILGIITVFVLKQPHTWIYTKYKTHKFRSISAFSPGYFFAWFILGLIHAVIFQFID
ncbi:MAG: hypothetical protein IH840_02850 [Candidatus Heimdallarchaeota archaeon]|nr:hypothetical protein [Candidatus Heimdallarchaeota archaeon]